MRPRFPHVFDWIGGVAIAQALLVSAILSSMRGSHAQSGATIQTCVEIAGGLTAMFAGSASLALASRLPRSALGDRVLVSASAFVFGLALVLLGSVRLFRG